MVKSMPVVHARSPQDRERIIATAGRIVASQIQAGKFDPTDNAHAAFYAAVEFIGG